MSKLLDFYCGNADRIAGAVEDPNPAALQAKGLIVEHAGFSGGLGLDELDLLFEAFALELDREPRSLADGLVRHVGGSGYEWSADVVDPELVALVAEGDDRIDDIAHRWLEELEKRFGNAPDAPGTDLMLAIEGLVILCQQAQKQGLDVVFAWRSFASLDKGFA